MAAKIDKEFLLKHRFWIGLGAFLLFCVVLVILAPLTIGSEAATRHKDYTDAVSAVDRIKTPTKDFANPNWEKPLEKKEEILKDRKKEVWETSWKTQAELMDWPGDTVAPLNSELKNAYFLDPIKKPDERQHFADTLYDGQWAPFKNAIAPAYYKGGDYRVVLQPVTNWTTSPPGSDECWFAQEDLWVKRELIDSIRAAIDTVARFDRVKEAPKDVPQGAVAAQSFRNVNWAVTVVLEKAAGKDKRQHLIISPKSTITNVNPNYRKLPLTGVFLEVEQRDKGGVIRDRAYLALEGDPVPYGETVKFNKDAQVDTFTPDQPMDVRQVFTWFTSPIKRLDRVEVGNRLALSHRFAKYALTSKSSTPAGGADTSTSTSPAPTVGMPGGTGMPTGMPGATGMMPGMPGSGAGPPGMPGMAGTAKGPGGTVVRDRYLEVSDQVRRMPVALVLVVDQSRIQDVLTALINNRLHVWITQWEWTHARGVPAPSKIELAPEQPLLGGMPGAEGAAGMPVPPMPGAPGAPEGGGAGLATGTVLGGGSGGTFPGRRPAFGSMMPPGMPMPTGMPAGTRPGMMFQPRPGGFGPLPPTDQLALAQEDANLVELTVYGIASLYERYPPRPPAAEGGQTPPAPAGGAAAAKPARP